MEVKACRECGQKMGPNALRCFECGTLFKQSITVRFRQHADMIVMTGISALILLAAGFALRALTA
ncbi:MAG: hypothetical protein U1F68_02665 [Gammaproteobacteria bacterium]